MNFNGQTNISGNSSTPKSVEIKMVSSQKLVNAVYRLIHVRMQLCRQVSFLQWSRQDQRFFQEHCDVSVCFDGSYSYSFENSTNLIPMR